MRWRRGHAPHDVAERLTRGDRWWRVHREQVPLSDAGTVRAWLRALRPRSDEQVMVHRDWGVVAAVAEPGRSVTVVLSDGEHSWVAESPAHENPTDLTPTEVEHVVVEALTSSGRPTFPRWRPLV